MKNRTKAILVDVLGFTLIVAAAPIGWIPGPGGIAVLVLGLSLLATNHEWAARIQRRVIKEAAEASKRVTEADPVTKWGIDIISIVFIAVAVWLFTQFTQSLAVTSAISFIIAGTIMIATNQNRHKRFWNKLKRKR